PVGTGALAYEYEPTGGAWTFTGQGVGVAGNGSGFTSGNSDAPQGSQVAFLQGAAGSISQEINATVGGSYTVSFQAAQRGNFQATSQTIQVLVDGQVSGTFTPSGTSYTLETSAVFSISAGFHTLSFEGQNPDGKDNTVFIDDVLLSVTV